ncbi:hypothetical protein QBC34DRAFT_396375 [Podospora aff. communis PSN243]|uniref:Uncharacterized protein n=1 Tax=Podospora aff. communis PSN243 TaxID=3040156 RepID=A0AAV9GXM4_9PEZI|nr:hypothetical protein QBC34DRAFT_396375 [Podospora aff. communis PSN243]
MVQVPGLHISRNNSPANPTPRPEEPGSDSIGGQTVLSTTNPFNRLYTPIPTRPTRFPSWMSPNANVGRFRPASSNIHLQPGDGDVQATASIQQGQVPCRNGYSRPGAPYPHLYDPCLPAKSDEDNPTQPAFPLPSCWANPNPSAQYGEFLYFPATLSSQSPANQHARMPGFPPPAASSSQNPYANGSPPLPPIGPRLLRRPQFRRRPSPSEPPAANTSRLDTSPEQRRSFDHDSRHSSPSPWFGTSGLGILPPGISVTEGQGNPSGVQTELDISQGDNSVADGQGNPSDVQTGPNVSQGGNSVAEGQDRTSKL